MLLALVILAYEWCMAKLKHEYSSRSFAVWCWKVGHIILTPNLTSWAHVGHFNPDKVLRSFSILAFYAEKEITVMTNIKVLLKSCDIEKQTVNWVPV